VIEHLANNEEELNKLHVVNILQTLVVRNSEMGRTI
jgi:hypothetical protein